MGRFFCTAALMFHFILVLFGAADARAGTITDILKARLNNINASESTQVIISFAGGTVGSKIIRIVNADKPPPGPATPP